MPSAWFISTTTSADTCQRCAALRKLLVGKRSKQLATPGAACPSCSGVNIPIVDSHDVHERPPLPTKPSRRRSACMLKTASGDRLELLMKGG
jgi:hypothetical protein